MLWPADLKTARLLGIDIPAELVASAEWKNSLLYTFSTISQTLATAFALLAAIILYRLQGLGEGLAVHLQELVAAVADVPGHEDLRNLQHRLDSSRFLVRLDELLRAKNATINQYGNDKVARYCRLQHVVASGAETRRRLRVSLYTTVFAIGFSTVLIPFSHLLASERQCLGVVLMIVGEQYSDFSRRPTTRRPLRKTRASCVGSIRFWPGRSWRVSSES